VNSATLQQNWGLILAASLLVLVGVSVIVTLFGRSAGVRLRRQARELRRRRAALKSARTGVQRCERRLSALQQRADRVAPRRLREAEESLEDARALAAIAHDQALIAANLLRRLIFEEFPPARHDSLRSRYLPGDGPDGRPSSF
jgi:hypothetical protein